MNIHCEVVADPAVTHRVARRYEDEIGILRRLQFAELCYYNESLFPFSAVVWCVPLVIMRAYREVIQIRKLLRISTSHPLLVERAHATYALVMGMGVKFYTGFADGTTLISANFLSREIHDQDKKVFKYAAPASIHMAWQSHQLRIAELQSQGKTLQEALHFDMYVRMSTAAEGR
jgi:hypothetical protein